MKSLGCAAFGDLLVSFEFPDDRTGIDIGALDDELEPVYAAHRDPRDATWAALMAVVERRTGVRLEEAGWPRATDCVPACSVPTDNRLILWRAGSE